MGQETDPLVNCCFRDRKSVRDLADQLVEQQPGVFPDRATVFRKGFHFLLRTLEPRPPERVEEKVKSSDAEDEVAAAIDSTFAVKTRKSSPDIPPAPQDEQDGCRDYYGHQVDFGHQVK